MELGVLRDPVLAPELALVPEAASVARRASGTAVEPGIVEVALDAATFSGTCS